MARDLDAQVESSERDPRTRASYLRRLADALVLEAREARRTVNVHAMIVTGINARAGERSPACKASPSELVV